MQQQQQSNNDQQQWNKIYETFNNWNDDAEHDDDNWNNHLDHDDDKGYSGMFGDNDYIDNSPDDDENFANFQFEIKKLSEMYSGSDIQTTTKPPTRKPLYNNEPQNQFSRQKVDTVVYERNSNKVKENQQSFDTFKASPEFQWSKSGTELESGF